MAALIDDTGLAEVRRGLDEEMGIEALQYSSVEYISRFWRASNRSIKTTIKRIVGAGHQLDVMANMPESAGNVAAALCMKTCTCKFAEWY